MTRPSVLAAHYAHRTGVSYAAAAERYGATRQATHRVYRKLYPDDVRATGSRPSASPRRHSVRVPGLATVRLDDAEIAAMSEAAARAGESLAGWFRALWSPTVLADVRLSTYLPTGVQISTYLRTLGRRAAGMDS